MGAPQCGGDGGDSCVGDAEHGGDGCGGDCNGKVGVDEVYDVAVIMSL